MEFQPSAGGDSSEGPEIEDMDSDVDCMEGLDGEVNNHIVGIEFYVKYMYDCRRILNIYLQHIEYWWELDILQYIEYSVILEYSTV